ncbi:MAG: polysaccharide biosynthesis C-terminal domain-containing protein [Bryobacteraceae bacterium]
MRASATRRTLDNSVLIGLDVAISFLAAMCWSIPVARVIGPAKLGYFSVVWFWALVGTNVASLGVPGATRRYMAEALGRNDLELARGIFAATMKLQSLIALGILIIGEAIIFAFTRPDYWSSSWLLVLSLAPRFLSSIPGAALLAGERLRQGLICSIVYAGVLIGVLWLGLWSGWGLVAAAAAYAIAYGTDLILKLAFTLKWLQWGPRAAIEPALRRRMISFSGKGTILMLLGFVVWDKSDIFFLQMLDKDPKSWSFFTTALGFAEKIIGLVAIFGSSISVALYGEIGRSLAKLQQTAAVGLKYCSILASVLLFGLAAVSPWLIVTLYGKAYAPAGPVLAVAALLAGGKCIMPVVGAVFAAAERQGSVAIIVLFCGALDVSLDLLLIPRYGALGAALANGVAQTAAAAILVWWASRSCGIQWRIREIVPGVIAGVGVGVIAYLAGRWLPSPVSRLAVGVAAGALACPILFRLLRVFGREDSYRLNELAGRTPQWVRMRLDPVLAFVSAPAQR